MSAEILGGIMFVTTLLLLLLGFPVALTLGGSALLFAYLGHSMDIFIWGFTGAYPTRVFSVMTNEALVAVPLFIFMGVMLEKSKVAEELLYTMGQMFGRMRGGLGMSVIIVGALLAASTGIVGATIVTMGLLSLPPMLRAGYDPKLATGIINASGTLGQIIPPSIVLILLGNILGDANQAAGEMRGNLAPDPVSAIDLFAGALFPGLLLVVMYLAYQAVMAMLRPKTCPAIPTDLSGPQLWRRFARVVVPPLALIVLVLGSILVGAATPTESAAVGAVGATVLAMRARQFSFAILRDVAESTAKISTMVFIILVGASMFSLVFRGFGGDRVVEDFLHDLPGGAVGAMTLVMAVIFVLGFFLDFIEIIFVVVPIVAPSLIALGLDPLWLGVMIGINLQTSFLTPPFGFALFYLRGVAPESVRTSAIYTGVIPIIMIQLLALGIIALFPQLATWLPRAIF